MYSRQGCAGYRRLFPGHGGLYAYAIQLLAEQLDVDPAKITLESDIMSDFEADSLDIVDMVMTLEDEFGIEVPDDAIESLRTVGDVVNFVDSHAQN